jgi:hypothetical protein
VDELRVLLGVMDRALGEAHHPHRLAALRFLESSTTVDKTLSRLRVFA